MQHAIDRIKERYGKELSQSDINVIYAGINKERFVYLNRKILDERYTILLKFENIPLKLVCDNHKHIITALPLDIDEVNKYMPYLPEVKQTICLDKTSDEKRKLEMNFKNLFSHEISIHSNLNFLKACKENINLNVEYASPYYVILWHYQSGTDISYSIFAINSLKRKIRNKVLQLVELDEFKNAKYLLELGTKINDVINAQNNVEEKTELQ